MTKLNEVYKCELCGNMVEVVHAAGGTLVCCGQNMKLMEENTLEAAVEKHVPIIERIDSGVIVKVGSVEHPMSEDHYIEFIELLVDGVRVCKKFLKPGEKPEATFPVKEGNMIARAYCNLHGFWKSE